MIIPNNIIQQSEKVKSTAVNYCKQNSDSLQQEIRNIEQIKLKLKKIQDFIKQLAHWYYNNNQKDLYKNVYQINGEIEQCLEWLIKSDLNENILNPFLQMFSSEQLIISDKQDWESLIENNEGEN